MKKIFIKKILSKFGFLPVFEQVNFYRQKFIHRKSNSLFKKNNPNVVLPPDFYLYETFNVNYEKFYTNGKPTAKWLVNHIAEFKELKNSRILDWGCGTGRIIRHLPFILDNSNSFYGTDYNLKYVNWCKKNLKKITFKSNDLKPPLAFNDNFFDVIYGISIFTHLSLELHDLWLKELKRTLRTNGIIFLTTHGDAHKFKLLEHEQEDYENGNLIVHSFKKEGNRLFASYQSPKFFKNLCKENNLDILSHIPGKTINTKPQQDVWILKKR